MTFTQLYSKHKVFATALSLVATGLAGLAVAHLFAPTAPVEARFICPAGTECPYDSETGEFIGYKNPWPAGCISIIPGAVSKPEVNMYNPTDSRASTTAPICRPEPVPVWRITYHERGHRMRNIGTYIDPNGCAQKFRADGSSLGLECFNTSTNGQTVTTTGTVLAASTNAGVVDSSLTPGSSFRYAGSDTAYYVTLANCKETYLSAATLRAWNLSTDTVSTVADSVQYATCTPDFVRLPDNSVVTADGVTMYLVRGNYRHLFTNYQGFLARGYTVNQAITIPQAELDRYFVGSAIH